MDTFRQALTGIGATAAMDLWLWSQGRLGGIAMIGRWVGHMPKGRFAHASIARTGPVRHEAALGWAAHYAVGMALALLRPAAWPALLYGVATVALPLLVMQPAMGVRFTWQGALRSLASHAVFGAGLALSAFFLQRLEP